MLQPPVSHSDKAKGAVKKLSLTLFHMADHLIGAGHY